MNNQNSRTTANALCRLWSASADTLPTEQLKWFAKLEETAQAEIDGVAVLLYETASLIDNAGDGAAPSGERLSAMLYGMANQIETASTLKWIGENAAHLLKQTRK